MFEEIAQLSAAVANFSRKGGRPLLQVNLVTSQEACALLFRSWLFVCRREQTISVKGYMKSRLVYTLDFSQISLKSLSLVGGKNSSLGELFNTLKSEGVGVLDGFATTADAYCALLAQGELEY